MENKPPKYVNPIKSIRIQNFKCLEDVKIDLSHLTFLFGPNSSGKSSFIKALLFLQKNLFPLNTGKTIFKINEHLDLGSYKDIVTNNDITKDIIFEIELKDNYYFPDIRLFDLENNLEYRNEIFSKNGYEYEKETIVKDLINKSITEVLNTDDFSYFNIFNFGELLNDFKLDYKIIIRFTEINKSKIKNTVFDHEMGLKKRIPKRNSEVIESNLKSISFLDLTSNSTLTLDTGKPHHLTNNKINSFNPDINLFGNDTLTKLFADSAVYNNKFNGEYSVASHLESFNSVVNFDDFNKVFHNIFLNEKYEENWKSFTNIERIEKYYEVNKFYYLVYSYIPILLINNLNTFHLPTVRELPKTKYLLNEGIFNSNEYYGFLNLLYETQEKIKIYTKKRKETYDLTKIDKSLKRLGFQFDMTITKNADVGKIILKYKNKRNSNLSDESSGLLQILPILISLNIYKSGNLVTIEQPELHLHPKLQAALADIFVESRKNQIIETHSEHLIRKLQVLIAQGKIEKSEILVYYFSKVEDKTSVKIMEIDDSGLFNEPWPNGFFDDSVNLTLDLYEALRTKNN